MAKNSSVSRKYNPEQVKNYKAKDIEEIKNKLEELEGKWRSLSPKKSQLQMEIQYYRAILMNWPHKNDCILDLHHLTRKGALCVLQDFLQFKVTQFKNSAGDLSTTLDIITGQGTHSKGGKSVLKPIVHEFLLKHGYKHALSNAGCILVFLKKNRPPG